MAKAAKKRGRGQPPWKPSEHDRKLVKTLAGYGFPQLDIAQTIGVAKMTLRKHCPDELRTGKLAANAKVAESLFKKATGNGPAAVTAAIWWSKTQMGWTEKTEHDVNVKGALVVEIRDPTRREKT